MSRTVRFNKRKGCQVKDGDQEYKHKYPDCHKTPKTKFYERIARQEVAKALETGRHGFNKL